MNHFTFELSLIAVLPALALCTYVFLKDRVEKEPLGLLAILFGAGAVAYIPSTLIENLILKLIGNCFADAMEATAEGFIQFVSPDAQYGYTALCAFFGFSLIRICIQWAVLFLITYRNKHFNYLFDGVVYSVFVSLGFVVAENVHFLLQNDSELLLPKLITSVPCQLFIGIIMGYFYTMAHMRFAANVIEDKLLRSGTVQKDNIRSSAPWTVFGIAIPFLASGLYALAGSVRNDLFSTFFYLLVFVVFGVSFYLINQIASGDVSYGKYLYRMIAKAHPELSPEKIQEIEMYTAEAKEDVK